MSKAFENDVLQTLRDWDATMLEAQTLEDLAGANMLDGFPTVYDAGGQLDECHLPCVRCALQEMRGMVAARLTVAERSVFLEHAYLENARRLNPFVARACVRYQRELAGKKMPA